MGAGLLEIVWATALKDAEGFTRLWPSVIGIAFSLVSFVMLAVALKSLPVGTAYAVWVGIGVTGVAIAGMLASGEGDSPLRLGFIAMIVIGVVGLRIVEGWHARRKSRTRGKERMTREEFRRLLRIIADGWNAIIGVVPGGVGKASGSNSMVQELGELFGVATPVPEVTITKTLVASARAGDLEKREASAKGGERNARTKE